MKRRWSILFWSALVTLVGVAWVSQRMGLSMSSWIRFQLIGMIVEAGVAFWAMLAACVVLAMQ